MTFSSTRWRRWLLLWGPVLVVATSIFGLSAIPGGPNLPSIPHMDKLAHLMVFGLLGLTIVRALSRTLSWGALPIAVLSIMITGAYGALDEFHQHFVPQRSVELADLGADVVGATLACLVWFAILKRFRGLT